MAGIYGIFSKENCVSDLFNGVFHLQHRAPDFCGFAWHDPKTSKIEIETREGSLWERFFKKLEFMQGNMGIGGVFGEWQPVLNWNFALIFDGNIVDFQNLKEYNGEKTDAVLASKIISRENDFISGIKKLLDVTGKEKGDFALIALSKEGIYAARGYGRKPLILGKKEKSWAVASESVAFPREEGFEIVRDVNPGEIVLLNEQGITSLKTFDVPHSYCAFEPIYTGYISSKIDGHYVTDVKGNCGKFLAEKFKNFNAEIDYVSPIPDSGRGHAEGFAFNSKLPLMEVFSKYPGFSSGGGRSYTPQDQETRDMIAKLKLTPNEARIKGKKIVVVDDSIVRGTQLRNRVKLLRLIGAEKVYAAIAFPPLMHACKYAKTTKKDEDCVARVKKFKELKEELLLDGLIYNSCDDIAKAIGLPKEQLCMECLNEQLEKGFYEN